MDLGKEKETANEFYRWNCAISNQSLDLFQKTKVVNFYLGFDVTAPVYSPLGRKVRKWIVTFMSAVLLFVISTFFFPSENELLNFE